jgi:hypothetical protein
VELADAITSEAHPIVELRLELRKMIYTLIKKLNSP